MPRMPLYTITDYSGLIVALRQADRPTDALQGDLDCTAKRWDSPDPPDSLKPCPFCLSPNTRWLRRATLARDCKNCGRQFRLYKRRVFALPDLSGLSTLEQVAALKQAGLSAQAIGDRLGFSRQRAHKYLQKLSVPSVDI